MSSPADILLVQGDTRPSAPTTGKILFYSKTDNKFYSLDSNNVEREIGAGGTGSGTVTEVNVSGGTTGLTTSGGPITIDGTITLDGVLNVEHGGTGATTLTGYVKGSGTDPLTASATIPFSDVTGTVPATQGGTGQAEYTIGDILYADTTTSLSKLSPGNVGDLLSSGGTGASPVWVPSPAANSNPLVFTTSENYRTLTGYTEGGTTSTVRTAEFVNNQFRLTLATFTPTLVASVTPASPNWDVPCTAFTVTVTNPDDFTTQYVSSVKSITETAGSITDLNTFTAGAQSATPAGGVDWNQTFTTNGSSYIRPISNTITGGTVTASVAFDYYNGSSTVEYTGSTASISVTWATPTLGVSLGSLTGNTFLETYTSVPYTVSVTGMSNTSNYVNTVTANGGTPNNSTGSGSFIFTTAIHKNNTASTRTVSVSTVFTRPATVTGTSYTATLTANTSNPSATFSYPSFWLYTASTLIPPTVSDVVSGSSFASAVTVLGNQVKTFGAMVTNSEAVPQGFWFAVRSSASQPTVFKTGPTSTLLSDVAVTTGNTVDLYPSPTPAGYVNEPYTLYGITLQPGQTYVSIS